MLRSCKYGSVFEVKPTLDKICFLFFMSTLLLFRLLYLRDLFFFLFALVMRNYSRFIILFRASCTIAVNLCEQGDHTFVFAHRKQEQGHVASEPQKFYLTLLPGSASILFPFGVLKKFLWDL